MRTLAVTIALLMTALCASATYLDCPANPSGTRIRPENRFFRVTPTIMKANTEVAISMIPLFDHVRPVEGRTYEITYTPVDSRAEESGWTDETKTTALIPEDGRYTFRGFFEGEQEHVLTLVEKWADKSRTLGEFRLYSLEEDLYSLWPYKGDIHMHSNKSDGVESPAYVAGACRRAGLDFMALTDHRFYASSIEARTKYDGVPIDLRIYPGEEVHAPGNPVHIVSFGASAGITEFWADEDAFRAEITALAEQLPPTPEGVDRYQYAASKWEFDKIRELGGLGMFAHAYWFTQSRNYISEALCSYLFETQPFDALELISGFDSVALAKCDTNALQVARYQEERAKGKQIPICGISDTHGVETSPEFGRYYTVCFAPSPELPDLIASIKNLHSVAVEAVDGELPRAYGPFRLVKYTLFLLREVFPRHDELCFEEGRLMIQYTSGDTTASDRLKLSQGQVARLYKSMWGQAE